MNSSIVTRPDLLNTFAEVAQGFSSAKQTIAKREKCFFDALDSLKDNLDAAIDSINKTQLSETNPLANRLKEYIEEFAHRSKQWQVGVRDFKRGTEFREQFDDSFLVFVYGKVKAGKSSLGNYIALGNSDPSDGSIRKNSTEKPVFKVHAQSSAKGGDYKNEAEQRQRFKVGETETTSSIQTFSLPGLTWVDSPGIHSMQGDNGRLAKDYVSSADLVVYAMSSHHPGRRTDLEEIFQLLTQRKPLIILLTGSDQQDDDEDEDGNIISKLVMKSRFDRDAQVDYVAKELNEIASDKKKLILSEVVPVSVKFAEISENAPDDFSESGMSRFLERMSEIAKGSSVRLKMNTPLNNLRSFGDLLCTS